MYTKRTTRTNYTSPRDSVPDARRKAREPSARARPYSEEPYEPEHGLRERTRKAPTRPPDHYREADPRPTYNTKTHAPKSSLYDDTPSTRAEFPASTRAQPSSEEPYEPKHGFRERTRKDPTRPPDHHREADLRSTYNTQARAPSGPRSSEQRPLEGYYSYIVPESVGASSTPSCTYHHKDKDQADYVKPTALYGTLWGVETLRASAVEPRKKALFFSDQTPSHETDKSTRHDLWDMARHDALRGDGKPSSASNRARQYRMIQALEEGLGQNGTLNLKDEEAHVTVPSKRDVDATLKLVLQKILTTQGENIPNLPHMSLDDIRSKIKLPQQLKVVDEGIGEKTTYPKEKVIPIYKRLIGEMSSELQTGQAPLLGLINKGQEVPMVFGFEKIKGLEGHTFEQKNGSTAQYSLQTKTHPLSGSSQGGKLKEIELHDLKDLSTMILGCLAEGAEVDEGVLIRLSPPSDKNGRLEAKARYLTTEQLSGFAKKLLAQVAKFQGLGSDKERALSFLEKASIPELQEVNDHLRRCRLEEFVPAG